VARVIYGSIIGLALVLVLDAHGATAREAMGSLLVTGFAVALAESFSEAIGRETRHQRWLERAELRHIASDAGAVAFGIAFPAAFFILAAAGAIETDTAYTLATWSGLGLIGCYGFAAARLAGSGLAVSLLHGFAVGLVGGFLIVMKALIH
jgi:hypothetical protein